MLAEKDAHWRLVDEKDEISDNISHVNADLRRQLEAAQLEVMKLRQGKETELKKLNDELAQKHKEELGKVQEAFVNWRWT